MNEKADAGKKTGMGQFFRRMGASCLGTLMGILLATGVSVVGSVILLNLLFGASETASVEDKSILVFNLSTDIKDTPPSSSLADALGSSNSQALTLRQVIGAIERASEDPKIVGLFLYGRGSAGNYGYATLAEVRKALDTFRASGKKIIAYDVDWTEKEYYLGSIASKVTINPVGLMEMNGLSSQGTFFAGALEKYGVGVQVVKVGSFKGAVEPYTRTDFSPPNRQQIQTVLDNVWSNYKSTVAASRQVTPEQLQSIADTKGTLDGEAAKKAGLVDDVAYFDQVIAQLRDLTGEKESDENPSDDFRSFRQVSVEDYAGSATATKEDSANKIAIVYAEGSIVDGAGDTTNIGGDRYAKELRKLRQDDDIKAVVLRINSPGGSAIASDVILREVKRLGEKKPVIISMGDFAASGGYWVATGGQRIFAEDNTLTGSIGVFGLLFNLQKIANNNGIKWDTIKTGKFADMSTSARPKTPEEMRLYQASVNRFYDLFIEKVSNARKLSPDKVRSIAQGRVWTGQDALDIGLVDEIGGLENAVIYAAKVAKLGDDWSIDEYPRATTWEEEIFSRLFQSYLSPVTEANDPLTKEWQKLQKELAKFQTLNDPRGIYTRLLFDFDFH
ncbi:signal peptide peptidase SppA [Pannus brasiliensis CCIBt3594]|uniref:Protease 4 n=2 Tax=Pannus TaxID=1427526 RepID=A0AAW9QQN0_9CHRO